MPKVSILIPAYNVDQFIGEAIQSTLSQTCADIEVVVCDDGSIDETFSIAEGFARRDSRVRLMRNRQNSGLVATRNALLDASRGEFISFLDSDDWLSPEKIAKQIQMIDRMNVEAAAVNAYLVGVDGRLAWSRPPSDDFVVSLEDANRIPFLPATLMISRNILNKVGGYHAYFSYTNYDGDAYWVTDILSCTGVAFAGQPLYYYRQNPNSVTRTLDLNRLAAQALVGELIRQRQTTGSDWLSRGHMEQAAEFQRGFLSQPQWVGEHLRIYSAMKTDEQNFPLAARYLWHAVRQNPGNPLHLRTFAYLMRSLAAALLATGRAG